MREMFRSAVVLLCQSELIMEGSREETSGRNLFGGSPAMLNSCLSYILGSMITPHLPLVGAGFEVLQHLTKAGTAGNAGALLRGPMLGDCFLPMFLSTLLSPML
jgi:hypothetical protein